MRGCATAWPQGTLLYLDAFLTGALPVPPAFLLSLTARQLAGYGIRFETLVEDLTQYQKEGFAVVVLTPNRRKAEALQTMLREKGLGPRPGRAPAHPPQPGELTPGGGGLSAGLDFPRRKFAILSEGGRPCPPASPGPGRPRSGTAAASGWSPSPTWPPGDLVVHEHHGIGRFVGMVKMTVDGVPRDYIKLQFAGTDTLYVPCPPAGPGVQVHRRGEDSTHKRLSKLGGAEWEKAKSKAKKAAKDMAKGLIQLYAQRQRLAGHAFAPDSPGSGSLRPSSPTRRPRTSSAAPRRSNATWKSPCPWTACSAGTWATAKPRWPSGPS